MSIDFRTSDDAQLAAHQAAKLRSLLTAILPTNRFYSEKLTGFEADDLRRLPFTTKADLLADQAAHPPYGSNLTYPITRYCRLHQTSGTATGRPLRWLDTPESWQWFLDCWRIKYECIGLRPEDRLFFPFSFGPFIGFWAAFEGAVRLGNLCLPGGGMSSAGRLRFMLDNAATVVCCTPTYALRLAEVAQRERIDLVGSPVRLLIVAGEPGGSIPATRRRIEESWGARVFDHTGMTEIGSCTIECVENPGGVHVLETEFIPEVIDAATGEPVPAGQEGELVLTNLGRWGSPLIRYRTGDRVVVDPATCPCGRSWLRLKGGILGRTDDMMVIRGNNVYPSALENIIRRFAGVQEFAIELADTGALTSLHLLLECQPDAPARKLAAEIAETVRTELNFRAEVSVASPGTLPRSEMKSRRVIRKM